MLSTILSVKEPYEITHLSNTTEDDPLLTDVKEPYEITHLSNDR